MLIYISILKYKLNNMATTTNDDSDLLILSDDDAPTDTITATEPVLEETKKSEESISLDSEELISFDDDSTTEAVIVDEITIESDNNTDNTLELSEETTEIPSGTLNLDDNTSDSLDLWELVTDVVVEATEEKQTESLDVDDSWLDLSWWLDLTPNNNEKIDSLAETTDINTDISSSTDLWWESMVQILEWTISKLEIRETSNSDEIDTEEENVTSLKNKLNSSETKLAELKNEKEKIAENKLALIKMKDSDTKKTTKSKKSA